MALGVSPEGRLAVVKYGYFSSTEMLSYSAVAMS